MHMCTARCVGHNASYHSKSDTVRAIRPSSAVQVLVGPNSDSRPARTINPAHRPGFSWCLRPIRQIRISRPNRKLEGLGRAGTYPGRVTGYWISFHFKPLTIPKFQFGISEIQSFETSPKAKLAKGSPHHQSATVPFS